MWYEKCDKPQDLLLCVTLYSGENLEIPSCHGDSHTTDTLSEGVVCGVSDRYMYTRSSQADSWSLGNRLPQVDLTGRTGRYSWSHRTGWLKLISRGEPVHYSWGTGHYSWTGHPYSDLYGAGQISMEQVNTVISMIGHYSWSHGTGHYSWSHGTGHYSWSHGTGHYSWSHGTGWLKVISWNRSLQLILSSLHV